MMEFSICIRLHTKFILDLRFLYADGTPILCNVRVTLSHTRTQQSTQVKLVYREVLSWVIAIHDSAPKEAPGAVRLAGVEVIVTGTHG